MIKPITIRKIQKYVYPYLFDIRNGLLDSCTINIDNPTVIINLSWVLMLFFIALFLHIILPESLSIPIIWIFVDIINIRTHIQRYHSNKSKPLPIAKIFTSRILLIFVDYGMECMLDWFYLPIDLIAQSLLISYYYFDLSLALKNKDFSFRTSYFRDRLFYYIGYGLPSVLFLYFNNPILFICTMFMALYSNTVLRENEKGPKYARWLPCKCNTIITDFDKFIEQLLDTLFCFILKHVDINTLNKYFNFDIDKFLATYIQKIE